MADSRPEIEKVQEKPKHLFVPEGVQKMAEKMVKTVQKLA